MDNEIQLISDGDGLAVIGDPEVRDKVLETGTERVDVSRRLGNEALDRARSVQGRLSGRIAERALRRRGGEDEERDEQG